MSKRRTHTQPIKTFCNNYTPAFIYYTKNINQEKQKNDMIKKKNPSQYFQACHIYKTQQKNSMPLVHILILPGRTHSECQNTSVVHDLNKGLLSTPYTEVPRISVTALTSFLVSHSPLITLKHILFTLEKCCCIQCVVCSWSRRYFPK